jgi:hypothetical protein
MYFNPKKMVSKLSEILSGLFIPDPDLEYGSGFFYPSREPGSRGKKKHRIPDTGFKSATLMGTIHHFSLSVPLHTMLLSASFFLLVL